MKTYELSKDVSIHVHACGEGGIFVNAHLVESARGVVAIDATLSESESKAFRREVVAIGKPLLAILITHPHPDHVAGITNLVGRDSVKIVSTQPVLDLMQKLEEPKRKQWTPVFGTEWVQRWTYPNTVVENGQRLTFDGVTYSVLDIGAGGDADSNSVWFIESPKRAVFVGDLVFNGIHSYIADGHLLAWLANLDMLLRLSRDLKLAFPGHGVAGPPTKLFAAQRDYLLSYAGHVKELLGGKASLTDQQKAELERRMTAYLANAGLTFLIGMSAGAVARELVGA